jgi:hypothetical protein
MMRLRRRRMPPELQPAFDAFVSVVAHVERGKSALTESMPSTRFAGRPLAESLLEFEEELAAAAVAMPAWRRPELEAVWVGADAGLRASMRLADRLRTDAPDPGGFEGLIAVIGELLSPLEAFSAAREALLALRT